MGKPTRPCRHVSACVAGHGSDVRWTTGLLDSAQLFEEYAQDALDVEEVLGNSRAVSLGHLDTAHSLENGPTERAYPQSAQPAQLPGSNDPNSESSPLDTGRREGAVPQGIAFCAGFQTPQVERCQNLRSAPSPSLDVLQNGRRDPVRLSRPRPRTIIIDVDRAPRSFTEHRRICVRCAHSGHLR
jgi:hypothetical protein